jgi:biotin operon repressor
VSISYFRLAGYWRVKQEPVTCFTRLLTLLQEKPFVTFSEMADSLSVNRSAIQKQIEGFRKKGYLDRRDDCSWHILAMNSKIENKKN